MYCKYYSKIRRKKNDDAQINECIIKIKELEEEIGNYRTTLNQN